jgi:4-amino-4-deoxy-L-arabinose transferase-like glycosyltransferase
MDAATATTTQVPVTRARRFTRRDALRVVLALAALTLVLRLPAFFVDVFNSDETFLATQGQVVQAGGNLYEEAADRKPPLVPYVYAASFELFDTTGLWSVRLVAIGAVVLTALLLASEARRRYGRRAGWAAGLLCVFGTVAFAPQDGQAANFEIFMLPAMTAGVVLARRARPGLAGVSVAVATLAKQTGALTLLPVLYLAWKTRGREGAARASIGFAIPLALVAVAVGPGQLLYWTVLGNGSYVSIQTASTRVLGMFLVMSLAWCACNLPLLWRLPAAWRDRLTEARDGRSDVDLWLWLASAAISVMVGLRFFGHYYLQVLPPVCLLAAGALSRGTKRIAVATVAGAAVLAVAFSAAGYFMKPFGPDPRYKKISRYLAAHTRDEERILVWGNVPEIYWASNRRPATRFPATNSLLAGNHPGRPGADAAPEDSDPVAWDWFFEDLTSHPPRYIVDTAPAKIRGAEWTPITRFPRLQAILEHDYQLVASINSYLIYQRK